MQNVQERLHDETLHSKIKFYGIEMSSIPESNRVLTEIFSHSKTQLTSGVCFPKLTGKER